MSTRIRKHDSDAAKRKKNKDRKSRCSFKRVPLSTVRDTQLYSENQTADVNVDDGHDGNAAEVEARDA